MSHVLICCYPSLRYAGLLASLDDSQVHAKICQVQGASVTNANSCTNQYTLWWALLTNGKPHDPANCCRGFKCLDFRPWSVFNTCKCHNTASYYKLRRKKMEKGDRKSPNPKTLDIQKKPDRKWVLVCPRKQILTTQVLADTEHGQGTRLCTDGTDPKTFRSSSSHPVHVETIGQGLGIFSWSTV